MKRQRKHYTPEKKVAVLRQHLLEKEAISKLCDELGLQPTVFYCWQKEFFENEPAAFEQKARPTIPPKDMRPGPPMNRSGTSRADRSRVRQGPLKIEIPIECGCLALTVLDMAIPSQHFISSRMGGSYLQ